MTEMRFGTVGSPRTTASKPGGSIGAIQEIRHLGLNALELAWVYSVNVTEKTCQAINTAGEANDVHLSIHAPYFINLNASAVQWEMSKKRLMDAAYFGNLAGASDIVFHPGTYFGQSPLDVLKIAIPRLSECRHELDKMGVSARLRPETMGKSAMLGSLEDTLKLSEEVAGVFPCLDFAHLHARAGDGSVNSYAEWMHVIDKYRKSLGEQSILSLHIHVSGIEYSSKGERNHLPFAEADFDVIGLLKALRNTGSSGRILCESPILEEDALYLKNLWEEKP